MPLTLEQRRLAQMSREGKLVKNALLLLIGTFLPKLATFITLPILTGFLTKEEYGTYDLITVLVTLYLPAVTLQIQTAAFRFLVDQRENREETKSIVSNIYAFIIPTTFIGLLALWFILPNSPNIKLYICLYFAADILVNSTRQIARGVNRNTDYSISSVIASFGNMILVVIFVRWLGIGLVGAILALLVSSFVSFVSIAFRLKIIQYIDFHCISKKKIKSLLFYSWPMVPNNMSMWIMRLSDRLVVTAVLGVAANAVYAVANKIPSLLNVAQSAFTLAWQENASIVSKDDDAEAYYSSMFYTIFNLMAGFLGLIICMTPLLFRVLVRGDYSDAYNQIPILFLATFFYTMATFLGGIYVAYMKTKSVGITTALAAGCNLIVDITFIRWIGLYAASGSTLISYLFLFVFRIVDLKRIIKLKYDVKKILIVSIILVVECALCYCRNTITNISNIALGITCFVYLNYSFIKVGILKFIKHSKNRFESD